MHYSEQNFTKELDLLNGQLIGARITTAYMLKVRFIVKQLSALDSPLSFYCCLFSEILKLVLLIQDVMSLISEMENFEPTFCPIYAQLCSDLNDKLPSS